MEQTVFYIFSALLLMSAGLMITVRNPVFAALFLILTFFSSSAIWLLLEAEFLAITLVVVYVGAVMVLFMFVVMMLDINLSAMREGFAKYLPIGVLVAILMALSMGLVINAGEFGLVSDSIQRHSADYSNTSELGLALYTNYLYPFEIAGAILLVAIIAAIALTMRSPRSTKTQKPGNQVAVKSTDRLRIVKMKVEKPADDPEEVSKKDSEVTTVVKESP
ncbi:MAG: NADH-quinone oxidoreductase subunit J [Gammaproteobacteria bacterium]|nr:MAG: NADH-quinone oxidoreductase subunit J [Gammaproteobacteria bacterium]RKZ71679.1 MAG: NADH-quinone oxidoreductase subunit J [Gammaproteobacteria bacterium]